MFEPGNQLWKLRTVFNGPARDIKDGEHLYELLIAYFQWVEENPIEENVVGWYQGDPTDHTVYKHRAMSVVGFTAHAGIDRQQWYYWRKEREDLKPVIEWAEGVMFDQKFAGAAAGVFKESIIARELGLADIQDHRSGDGSMSKKPTIIEFVAPDAVNVTVDGAKEADVPAKT